MKIAILYGGPGNEREVSIKTGKQVAKVVNQIRGYQAILIELTRELRLSQDGALIMWKDLGNYDFVFIAIHGAYGEDGKVQAILESLHIPYNGPDAKASLLGMDKMLTQQIAFEAGLDVPYTTSVYRYAKEAFDQSIVTYPCVVKPNQSGSSVGISVVTSPDQLNQALDQAFLEDDRILIQEYIQGQELTCGVMKNQGEEAIYTLSPIEIRTKSGFFDYHNKYESLQTEEICPTPIPEGLTKRIQKQAEQIHDTLKCDGLTRSDFRYDPNDDRLVFLEINTIPGQTEASLCPKEAKSLGKSFDQFIQDQIQLGLKAHK